MTTSVLDASAILAYLLDEPGADEVEAQLETGAACGAANWSEVAQRIRAAERDWDLVRALLLSHPLAVEPISSEDAEWAALRWRRGEGLSLGDRLCLAVAARLGVDAWTADRRWGTGPGIRQIR